MSKLKNLPTLPPDAFSKEDCRKDLAKFKKELFGLQNIFYADHRFALLIIFQGVDASGKDGTIRHALTSMNPMGVQVKSFKKPSEEELDHDFLWRVYPHFPAKGMIEVFNRSYYEDIIVPTIDKSFSKEEIHHRCQLINELEQHLERSDIQVLKFFLHISKDVQKKRIEDRLNKSSKHWKYKKEDEEVAKNWDDYNDVYDSIINECSSKKWHIIPADKRWYRNYKVAEIITHHLQSLQLGYSK